MARLVTTAIANWCHTSEELLERLARDWTDLRSAYRLADSDHVRSIRATGDSHNGGRSVQVVELASGARFVYKPRSMAVDLAFQQVLGWMNDHGMEPALRHCLVLDRGSYGWQEFVPAQECRDEAEVVQFYARLGAFTALFFLLEGTDCHYENVIACGSNPIWIDLEGLFQGRTAAAPATSDIAGCYWDSVLRTGILPCRVSSEYQPKSVDYCALSGPSDGVAPRPVLNLIEECDGFRLQAVERNLATGGNKPSLNGTTVEPAVYRDTFIDGFRSAFRIVLANKGDWTGSSGLLNQFAGVGVRAIVRQTRVYGELFTDLAHPELATDAMKVENHLAILWNAVKDRGLSADIAAAECRDLWAGDIPAFSTTPSSRSVERQAVHPSKRFSSSHR